MRYSDGHLEKITTSKVYLIMNCVWHAISIHKLRSGVYGRNNTLHSNKQNINIIKDVLNTFIPIIL